MPFPIPSQSDTRDYVAALMRALFPGRNTARRAFYGRQATFLSGSVTEVLAHADSAQRDLHPLTAGDGKPINDWGTAVGVERKLATPARKSAAGRVRGAAALTFDSGRQLRHEETGLLFKISQVVTVPGVLGDPASFVDVDIAAVDVGSKTRLPAGSVLRFLTTPVGAESSVVLQLDLDEDGFDVEQFGSYRRRFLETFSETPAGGNQSDFQRWAIEAVDSVVSAFAYPNRAGRGTLDVVVFYAGSGTSRSVSVDDRAAVLSYLKKRAPFQISGDGGGLRVLTTISDPQRVEIKLTTNGVPAFRFHWDDSSHPTVLSWNGTTRELRFAANLPTSLRAGHSLILDGVASVQDGREFKIESLSGVDKVILQVAPQNAPAATDKIYSGGPLVKPVRDAIVAHLNGEIVYAGRGLRPIPESQAAPANPNGQSIIGLDELVEGIGSANPAGRFGPWNGGIQLATLFRIATFKAGVRNAVIVSPAVDYEATDDQFPLDAQIHYVSPGAVVVRAA